MAVIVFYCKFKKTARRAKDREDAIERENLLVMGNPEDKFNDFLENLGSDVKSRKMADALRNMYIDIEKIVPTVWNFDVLQGKEIGAGAFGTAYKVDIDVGTKKTVVVKGTVAIMAGITFKS